MWEILEHRTVQKWIGFPPFIWIPLPSTSLEIFHQGPHVIWMKSYGIYEKGIHDKDLIFHLETSEKTLLLQGCGLEITAVVKMCSVAQLCPPFCDPMDCSSPSSSVHGILQARTLEWVAISFSNGKEIQKRGDICICMDGLFTSTIQQKLTPHCKATILQ